MVSCGGGGTRGMFWGVGKYLCFIRSLSSSLLSSTSNASSPLSLCELFLAQRDAAFLTRLTKFPLGCKFTRVSQSCQPPRAPLFSLHNFREWSCFPPRVFAPRSLKRGDFLKTARGRASQPAPRAFGSRRRRSEINSLLLASL